MLVELVEKGSSLSSGTYGVIEEVTVYGTDEFMTETATDNNGAANGESLEKYGLKLNIVFTDGTEEEKELDIDELEDELLYADTDGRTVFINELSTANAAVAVGADLDTDGENDALIDIARLKTLLEGKVVKVDVSGGQYVLEEVEDIFDVDFEVATAVSTLDEDENDIITTSSLGTTTVDVETEDTDDDYVKVNGKRYYFDETDMLVMVQDASGDFDFVESDDLADDTGLSGAVVIGLDEDDEELEVLYLPNTANAGGVVAYNSSDLVGMVVETSYVDEDDDDNDIYEIKVATVNGVESYEFTDKDSQFNKSDVEDNKYVGRKITFKAQDDEMTKIADVTELPATLVAGKMTDAASEEKDYIEFMSKTGVKTEVDKYETVLFVSADIEAEVKGTDNLLTITSEVETPELDGVTVNLVNGGDATLAVTSTTPDTGVVITVTSTDLTDEAAIETAINEELESLGFEATVELTGTSAAGDSVTLALTALTYADLDSDSFKVMDQSDVNVTDEDNWLEASNDEAHTVYYYVTDADDDTDADEHGKVIIVLFDDSEF